uniref:Uncharacterized protein n=1 Tax=Globisporangium ultimum (strain ATCC 200006 / CBS 805.95 / DAOM BR144) TaxID=431595 RepID=K3WQD2_GLOUD
MATQAEASGLDGFISDVDALLAESEALLGSIDTTPVASVATPQGVAAPSVGGDNEDDKRSDGSNGTQVTSPDAVAIKKKRSRNSTRDREKAEIELLRVQVTSLVEEATALRVEKTQVSQALAPVWRRLAESQLQGKQKAEKENKYLRTELEANALTLRRLREILAARLKQQHSGRVLRNEQRRCMEWIDAVMFARLKAELADAYARTDDVVRESGIHSMLEDGVEYSHSRKLCRKDESQSYSSELASSCSGYLGEKQQKDIMAIKFQRKVMQRYKEGAR